MALFKPTYQQLIDKINEENDKTIVTSRYPVVLAAAKRARQLVDGDTPLVKDQDQKPLSMAVEELFEGEVQVKFKNEEEETDKANDM